MSNVMMYSPVVGARAVRMACAQQHLIIEKFMPLYCA